MAIDSFSLVEHFDFMKRYIPQPFYIKSEDVKCIKKDEDQYFIETNKWNYDIAKSAMKKLVDSLGVKIKLLDVVADEVNVIDMVMPIINKLFKSFADCFVFYAKNEEPLSIIDLNVNNQRGDEGTIYENGPSPWEIDIESQKDQFTCFINMLPALGIDENESDILVKADDIMPNNSQVLLNLFRSTNSNLQPMLVFTSKFSNMSGFTEIHPAIYDTATGINMVFPMNYHTDEQLTFDEMWDKTLHVHSTMDVNDYIFSELSELAISDDVPNGVKKFISDILCGEFDLNVNQPIKDILVEANQLSESMKIKQASKFKSKLGIIIAWACMQKHKSCSSCGHITIGH